MGDVFVAPDGTVDGTRRVPECATDGTRDVDVDDDDDDGDDDEDEDEDDVETRRTRGARRRGEAKTKTRRDWNRASSMNESKRSDP